VRMGQARDRRAAKAAGRTAGLAPNCSERPWWAREVACWARPREMRKGQVPGGRATSRQARPLHRTRKASQVAPREFPPVPEWPPPASRPARHPSHCSLGLTPARTTRYPRGLPLSTSVYAHGRDVESWCLRSAVLSWRASTSLGRRYLPWRCDTHPAMMRPSTSCQKIRARSASRSRSQ
jgi:hypothetical protein